MYAIEHEDKEATTTEQSPKKKRNRKPNSHYLCVPAFDYTDVPDWLDDVTTGVLQTFVEKKANKNNQSYVNKTKLFYFMSVHSDTEFTSKDLERMLQVSPRTARQYAEVLRLISLYVERAKVNKQLYKTTVPFHSLPPRHVPDDLNRQIWSTHLNNKHKTPSEGRAAQQVLLEATTL